MKYKHIIQEMKEANDPNMMAFVKDVEKMKPLTKKEKDHYLQTRFLPESVQKLVEDFIPYIIFVAYGYKDKSKSLKMLDLINEGILGAYAAFDKSTKDGRLTKIRVYNGIRGNIQKAIRKDTNQSIAEYSSDICLPEGPMDDEGDIMDVDRESVRNLLMDSFVKNFGSRDAEIIYDYYWGKTEDLQLLSVKYDLTCERCRQVIKKVKSLNKTEIKRLKGCLQ